MTVPTDTADDGTPPGTIIFAPLVFCALLALYVTLPVGHPGRWAIYTTPALVVFELSARKALSFDPKTIALLCLYGVYGAALSLGTDDFSFAIRDMIFISLPFSSHPSGSRCIELSYAFLIAVFAGIVILISRSEAPLLPFRSIPAAARKRALAGIRSWPACALSGQWSAALLAVLAMTLMYKRIALAVSFRFSALRLFCLLRAGRFPVLAGTC